ncbi:MAG: hypothetical protein MUF62_09900 [Chitinophagaceae bacterium]|nr:hypothetical protein [Chitinophagaceae bacterium]
MLLRLLCLITLVQAMPAAVSAQPGRFQVALSTDKLAPGDTLDIIADYEIGDRELPPATFVMTIIGPQQQSWRLRWPLEKGHAEASVVWPAHLPEGAYNLRPANILALFGEGEGMQAIPVKPDKQGRFTIDKVYLEESMPLTFASDSEREPGPALVQLDAWLDSSFGPAATGASQVLFARQHAPDAAPQKLSKQAALADADDVFSPYYQLRKSWRQLQAAGLSGLALYDSLFVPDSLRRQPQAVMNGLADTLGTYGAVYDWLAGQLKGMAIAPLDDMLYEPGIRQYRSWVSTLGSERMVRLGEQLYRLYYRGRYGSVEALLLPAAAYAAVYVQAPAGPGSFGRISLFDRRYPFEEPFPARNTFLVSGYSPAIAVLADK